MKIVNREMIAGLLKQAAANPRRRTNLNFHESPAEDINRLLIAAMPDTEFPLHRHPGKPELLVMIEGEMEGIFTDDDGKIVNRVLLAPGGENCAIELPAGMWHTYKAHTPVVFLEVKHGPYEPAAPEDMKALRTNQ